MSALSELLDDISTMDPVNFAMQLVEKCIPTDHIECETVDRNRSKAREETEFETPTGFSKYASGSTLSDIEESESTFVKSSSDNSTSKDTYIDEDTEASEPVDNALNFSLGSAGSIKTTKLDTGSNCSLPPTKHNATEEFPRSASSCSSASSSTVPLENGYSLHYGCMRYLNSNVEHNKNGMSNLLPVGGSNFPCSHFCAQHTLHPNLLAIGAPNSLQAVFQNGSSGQLLLPGK